MHVKLYQEQVKRTANQEKDFFRRVVNWTWGLAGEVGELLNKMKKVEFHGHPENIRNQMIDEMGDVMWYIAMLCNEYNIELTEVMEKNIFKLKERYPDNFSSERSINRNEE